MGAAISAANMQAIPSTSAGRSTRIATIQDSRTLYLQSCSGGIYEDDRLDLTLARAQGAEAHVSTQAATVFTPWPSGSATQRVAHSMRGRIVSRISARPQFSFPARAAVRKSPSGSAAMPCAGLGLLPHARSIWAGRQVRILFQRDLSSRMRPARLLPSTA